MQCTVCMFNYKRGFFVHPLAAHTHSNRRATSSSLPSTFCTISRRSLTLIQTTRRRRRRWSLFIRLVSFRRRLTARLVIIINKLFLPKKNFLI